MSDAKHGHTASSLVRTDDEPAAGVQALWFAADGWVPNNRHLPALHYRNAVRAAVGDGAAAFERLFSRNGWRPQWRNGIYPFHHYHSTAHEVLGIAAGSACVQLGGPHGAAVAVTAGDCVLLPAGTGHCLLEASTDLLVVGAYPPGQNWDLRRDALSSTEHGNMAALPIPTSDPVGGPSGALSTLWSRPV
jgi:uncharacterized protein YjlB